MLSLVMYVTENAIFATGEFEVKKIKVEKEDASEKDQLPPETRYCFTNSLSCSHSFGPVKIFGVGSARRKGQKGVGLSLQIALKTFVAN